MSDIADDIVPSEAPQHVSRREEKRLFKPWHRVRKQYIRERQWNHEIMFLAKRYLRNHLQTEESAYVAPVDETAVAVEVPESVRIERPLRCLVLPSDELLDIRSLVDALRDEGCYLRYFGFNNTLTTADAKKTMALSEAAVVQLSRVCSDSQVIGDAFQGIANKNSQAYNLFRRHGPYDVVNLDLCDSLVPRGKPDEMETNLGAILRLFEYQVEHQRTPWLFFATTQVDRESLHQAELNRLADPLRTNCDSHVDFAQALAELIPEAAFQSEAHRLDITHLGAEELVRVFGVVLGKWLIHILIEASPKCSVSLVPSYRYVIRPDKNVEMLSLGFLIKPYFVPPVDKTGASVVAPAQKAFPTELEAALGLVRRATQIKDVDALLGGDQDLKDTLILTKAQLLAACGYSSDEYMEWALAGEPDQ